MKNIQEIILKSGRTGKLILGDEEIDVCVVSTHTKISQREDFTDSKGAVHKGKNYAITHLDIELYGKDFCGASNGTLWGE